MINLGVPFEVLLDIYTENFSMMNIIKWGNTNSEVGRWRLVSHEAELDICQDLILTGYTNPGSHQDATVDCPSHYRCATTSLYQVTNQAMALLCSMHAKWCMSGACECQKSKGVKASDCTQGLYLCSNRESRSMYGLCPYPGPYLSRDQILPQSYSF